MTEPTNNDDNHDSAPTTNGADSKKRKSDPVVAEIITILDAAGVKATSENVAAAVRAVVAQLLKEQDAARKLAAALKAVL